MKHILVVEDERQIVRVIQAHLERARFAVSVANDGEQALQRLGQKPAIDLIITDIVMPVMDGFQLINEIRQQPVFASIPIIIMGAIPNEFRPEDPPGITREDREQQIRRALISFGAFEFIAKPFHPADLVEKVRTMLT